MKTKPIKILLTIICACCVLTSCDNTRGGGGGGPAAHIEISSSDEATVIEALNSWLTERGYEKRDQSWSDLTGDGSVGNNNGEIVLPVSHVKDLSEGRGHFAFGVASSTENHKYITVFYDFEYVADGEDSSDKHVEDSDRELGALRDFIDTSFPNLRVGG